MENNKLTRFLDAQNQMYLTALNEIKCGRKKSHWMWFIFPQLKGLGRSSTADYYGIADLPEASAYLQHPILGKHLIEISTALLSIEGKEAVEILGTPDDLKLCSSMTLFSHVENTNTIFQDVLDKYFEGKPDRQTLHLLSK